MFGRLLVIATFATATATAQFTSLAATGDGSVLYFSSSLNLRTDNGEPNWPKIFRYRQSTGAFELAYEFATPPITWPGPDAKGAYMLANPDVSSDGNKLVYTATGGYCAGGSGCIGYPGPTPEAYLVQGSASPRIIANGSARLSRNGRYVYVYPEPANCVTCVDVPGQLNDLQTPTTSNLPLGLSLTGDGRQVISDDGAVLFGQLLFRQSQQTFLPMTHIPITERMSADAAIIVYESSGLLIRFTVATGQETVLARAAGIPSSNDSYFQPWLSDDGSLVSYLNQPAGAAASIQQVFLARTDGSAPPQQLTAEPEGIASAVLAGSGNIVYAVTATSRIIQVQATGQVTELSGPISVLATGSGAPGSVTTLQATEIHPPGTSLTVKIGGMEAPVLGFDGNSILIQIPWELAGGNPLGVPSPIDISTAPGASVSQFDESFSVSYVAPVFLAVAHQDFHGPVTSSDPAIPQEIVHIFMTGLGPVSPTIATGTVTPVGALYNLTSPPACSFDFSGVSVPAPLLFAGLAPGTIGVYQVDVKIPPPGNLIYGSYFNCTDYLLQTPQSAYWDFVQVAVPVVSP